MLPASPGSPTLTEHRLTVATGVELHYVEQGNPHGEVLIFLHGFTDSWRTWQPILPSLSLAYHTFALSQRGHGDSSKPACCYRVENYTSDVLAFLDALHIARATLVGHSMGSYIAYQVAGDHPERIERLVLLGWGPISPTSAAARERVERLYAYVQSRQGTIDPEFIRTWIASNTVMPLAPEEMEAQVAESLKVPLITWQQLLASRLAAGPHPPVGPIKARTLVLYGDKDVYVDEGQHLLRAEIPHATVITYPGTGHALHWDSHQRFIDDLHAFLTAKN